jgi:hypothetical protein
MVGATPMTAASKSNGGNFQIAKEGWLKIVASHATLPGAAYAVAIVLASYLNSKTNRSWPSIATLVANINRDRSTVLRAIKKLEICGLLAIKRRRGRSSEYQPRFGHLEPARRTAGRLRGRAKELVAGLPPVAGLPSVAIRTRTGCRIATEVVAGLPPKPKNEPQKNRRKEEVYQQEDSLRSTLGATLPAAAPPAAGNGKAKLDWSTPTITETEPEAAGAIAGQERADIWGRHD